MNKYQEGYQAALADITAVMENVPTYSGYKVIVKAVEEWIANNTISDSKDFEYRGYYVVWNSALGSYEIYSNKDDADNQSDMITRNKSINGIRSIINMWRNAK